MTVDASGDDCRHLSGQADTIPWLETDILLAGGTTLAMPGYRRADTVEYFRQGRCPIRSWFSVIRPFSLVTPE